MESATLYENAVRSLALKDTEAAIRYAEPVVAQDPEHPAYLMLLGNIYTRTQQYEKAETIFRQTIRLFPDNPEVLNNLAVLLKLQGRIDEAERVAIEAAERTPDRADIHYNLGNIYKQNQKADKKEEYRTPNPTE